METFSFLYNHLFVLLLWFISSQFTLVCSFCGSSTFTVICYTYDSFCMIHDSLARTTVPVTRRFQDLVIDEKNEFMFCCTEYYLVVLVRSMIFMVNADIFILDYSAKLVVNLIGYYKLLLLLLLLCFLDLFHFQTTFNLFPLLARFITCYEYIFFFAWISHYDMTIHTYPLSKNSWRYYNNTLLQCILHGLSRYSHFTLPLFRFVYSNT